MSFLEELVKKGIIEEGRIGEIKTRAQTKFAGNLDEALLESGVAEETILETKGEYFQIPVKKINIQELSFDVLKYISEDSAGHYGFAPLDFKDGVLNVGVTDPENIQAMDALQFISAKAGIPFKIFLISKRDYTSIMDAYKGIDSQVEEALKELNAEEEKNLKGVSEENLNKEIDSITSSDKNKIVEDAPVIKIVAGILKNAIEGNGSDIHI